jgi:hypothetical protein
MAEKYRRSLREFTKAAWPTIEPGVDFQNNWHIDAISDHLEAVVNGDIKRLIINVPPRHMKSISVAVAMPAWTWVSQPHKKFLYASYAASLSIRDSTKCRRLIDSPWYKAHFGDKFRLTDDQNQKQRFENDKTGYRIATSVGNGALTGDGGDLIVHRRSAQQWSIADSAKVQGGRVGLVGSSHANTSQRPQNRRVRHHHAAPARARPDRPRLIQPAWQ